MRMYIVTYSDHTNALIENRDEAIQALWYSDDESEFAVPEKVVALAEENPGVSYFCQESENWISCVERPDPVVVVGESREDGCVKTIYRSPGAAFHVLEDLVGLVNEGHLRASEVLEQAKLDLETLNSIPYEGRDKAETAGIRYEIEDLEELIEQGEAEIEKDGD